MNLNLSTDRAKCLKAGIDMKTIEKLYLMDNGIVVSNIQVLQENPVLQHYLGTIIRTHMVSS